MHAGQTLSVYLIGNPCGRSLKCGDSLDCIGYKDECDCIGADVIKERGCSSDTAKSCASLSLPVSNNDDCHPFRSLMNNRRAVGASP